MEGLRLMRGLVCGAILKICENSLIVVASHLVSSIFAASLRESSCQCVLLADMVLEIELVLNVFMMCLPIVWWRWSVFLVVLNLSVEMKQINKESSPDIFAA
jgi:hypothetical protein